MIVYPDAVWYGEMKPGDVEEIVTSHLKNGNPVSRRMLADKAALRGEILEHRRQYMAMIEAKDRAGILPEDFNERLRAFMPSRALLSGVELDLFTAIGSGQRAEQLAAKLCSDLRATEMLANALVALGVLEKREGVFHNTPLAARFLSDDSPDSARAAIMHTVNLWETWSTLTECVRAGTSVLRRAGRKRDAESLKAFIAAMDRIAGERAPLVVRSVGNGFRHMLDLGGGSGAYSIAFARSNPELHSEVLDVQDVLPLTQGYIKKAGLESRISTRPGDLLADRFGSGYDLILLSSIVHMFSPEQNLDLLRRAYEALAPAGQLVIQEFVLEPDKTAPVFAALFSLNMLTGTEGGASYSETEYEAWLRQTGFSEVNHLRLPGPSGLMVARK
jgi:SAM-dependent methyltransferase